MTTVYTKPDCVQCERTQAKLTQKHVPFTTRDVIADPDAYRFVTQTLGYKQVPVVVTDNGENWSGFRPDKIAQLAASRHAPSAAETAATGSVIPSAHLDR